MSIQPAFGGPAHQYMGLYPGSRLWEMLGGTVPHPNSPASQWFECLRGIRILMWRLAATCRRRGRVCPAHRAPRSRRAGWVRQLLPGEIPGSPVWVTALDEVRRYRTADFYADDLEETQRYVKRLGSDRDVLRKSCSVG